MNSKLIAAMPLIVLMGCATGQGSGNASAQSTTADDKSAESPSAATRLPRAKPSLFVEFSDICPISQEGKAESLAVSIIAGQIVKSLAETVVPSAVGWLYDKGTGYLERRHTKLLSSSTATNFKNYYKPDTAKGNFGCIIIARAERGTIVSDNYASSRHGTMTIDGAGRWERQTAADTLKTLKMIKAPEFYFELALSSFNVTLLPKTSAASTNNAAGKKRTPVSTDAPPAEMATLYREIKPVRLDYLDTGAESQGKDRQKYVSLEVNMEAMNPQAEWKTIFSKTYDFGLLDIGASNIALHSLGSEIFIPPASFDGSQPYFDPVPVRVTAILTETDDGADFSRALALSLRDAQARKSTVKGVSDAITSQIDAAIDARLGKAGASAGKPGASADK